MLNWTLNLIKMHEIVSKVSIYKIKVLIIRFKLFQPKTMGKIHFDLQLSNMNCLLDTSGVLCVAG
ncbi:hypothetical protein J22TS3_32350 [Paenibacillus sp. J22TS3]|nr:hypothetical protein J22TS3_32350 [Paenibacillus sp. J22TS3]